MLFAFTPLKQHVCVWCAVHGVLHMHGTCGLHMSVSRMQLGS